MMREQKVSVIPVINEDMYKGIGNLLCVLNSGLKFAPFRLTMFGTFPILRPIFHAMKNVGRVILEECKGQARRLAERQHEQLTYRVRNSNFSK